MDRIHGEPLGHMHWRRFGLRKSSALQVVLIDLLLQICYQCLKDVHGMFETSESRSWSPGIALGPYRLIGLFCLIGRV